MLLSLVGFVVPEELIDRICMAQRYLFPQNAYESLISIMTINDGDIMEYAARYETHPSIIVGQLQHSGIIGYHQGNHFKMPINLFD